MIYHFFGKRVIYQIHHWLLFLVKSILDSSYVIDKGSVKMRPTLRADIIANCISKFEEFCSLCSLLMTPKHVNVVLYSILSFFNFIDWKKTIIDWKAKLSQLLTMKAQPLSNVLLLPLFLIKYHFSFFFLVTKKISF